MRPIPCIPVVVLAITLPAQTVCAQLATVFVCQPNEVVKLVDLNGDGDFLDFAEHALYADGLSLQLDRLARHAERLFVGDRQTHEIIVIEDLNSDGDALDSAEVLIYGQLPPGMPTQQLAGLAVLPDGSLLAADAVSGELHRFTDLNADGDTLDFGEQMVIAENLSSPSAIGIRPDGSVLIAQDPIATPVMILEDRNLDGDYLDFAENLSYVEGLAPGEDIAVMGDTLSYITRPATDEIVALRDLNGDNDVLDFSEVILFAEGLDTPFVLTGDGSGGLFVAAQDTAGTLYRVRDLNGDGDALDANELLIVAVGLNQPSGITLGVSVAPCLKGDVNEDTFVDFNDVPVFVDILIGNTIPPDPCPPDVNNDGQINGLDIQSFVDMLT